MPRMSIAPHRSNPPTTPSRGGGYMGADGKVRCSTHYIPAKRFISRTTSNPNRCFYRCGHPDQGCNFWKWADEVEDDPTIAQVDQGEPHTPTQERPPRGIQGGQSAGTHALAPSTPSKRPHTAGSLTPAQKEKRRRVIEESIEGALSSPLEGGESTIRTSSQSSSRTGRDDRSSSVQSLFQLVPGLQEVAKKAAGGTSSTAVDEDEYEDAFWGTDEALRNAVENNSQTLSERSVSQYLSSGSSSIAQFPEDRPGRGTRHNQSSQGSQPRNPPLSTPEGRSAHAPYGNAGLLTPPQSSRTERYVQDEGPSDVQSTSSRWKGKGRETPAGRSSQWSNLESDPDNIFDDNRTNSSRDVADRPIEVPVFTVAHANPVELLGSLGKIPAYVDQLISQKNEVIAIARQQRKYIKQLEAELRILKKS